MDEDFAAAKAITTGLGTTEQLGGKDAIVVFVSRVKISNIMEKC